MMNRKIFYLLPIIACFALMFASCSDDKPTGPNTPTSVNVTGKAVNEYGQPVSGAVVYVNGTSRVTAADGGFTFNDTRTPYDIKIVYNNASGMIYEGISVASPVVKVYNAPTQPDAQLTVNFPQLSQNTRAAIYFTNGNDITFSKVGQPGNNQVSLDIYMRDNVSIQGKVIMLLATTTLDGRVASYTGYGEKLFTVNKNVNTSTAFASGDLYDPRDSIITGIVNTPASITNTTIAKLNLNFGNVSNISSPGVSMDAVLSNAYSFVVPMDLPTTVKINLTGQGTTNAGEVLTSMTQFQGGIANVINIPTNPQLVSPVTNFLNADTNTVINFSSGSAAGIHEVSFIAGGIRYYVITSGENARVPNFYREGIPLPAATTFTWMVAEYANFSSMNDFVTESLFFNNNYRVYTSSSGRVFTTRP